MKRGDLLRHLRRHGCYLKREGRSHSLWTNPTTGASRLCRATTRYRMPLRVRSAVGSLYLKSRSDEVLANSRLQRLVAAVDRAVTLADGKRG